MLTDTQLAEIKARLETANPYELAYQGAYAQLELWQAAIKDGLDLLAEIKRLEKELALAGARLNSTAAMMPR